MGYAGHIGRVGALAVALGVSAALATMPAIGNAEPSGSDGSATSSQTSDASAKSTSDAHPSGATSASGDDSSASENGSREGSSSTLTSGAASDSAAGKADAVAPDEDKIGDIDADADHAETVDADIDADTDDADSADAPDEDLIAPRSHRTAISMAPAVDTSAGLRPSADRSTSRDVTAASADGPAPSVVAASADDRAHDPQPVSTVTSTPSAASAPAAITQSPTSPSTVEVASRMVEAALWPLLGGDPGSPAPLNLLLGVMELVRREIEDSVGRLWSVAAQQTSSMLTASAANPFGWLTQTFFAASPTIDGQTISVPVALGASSPLFALGGSSADGRALSIVGPTTLVGSAGGTVQIGIADAISQGAPTFTAVYTPKSGWDGTPYTDTFHVTVSDADNGFHIHGLLGLMNLLSFGLLGDAGHTATATVTVQVVAPGAEILIGAEAVTICDRYGKATSGGGYIIQNNAWGLQTDSQQCISAEIGRAHV